MASSTHLGHSINIVGNLAMSGASANSQKRETDKKNASRLLSMPKELINGILDFVGPKKDLLNFMLGNRECHDIGLPQLWRNIQIARSVPNVALLLETGIRNNAFLHVKTFRLAILDHTNSRLSGVQTMHALLARIAPYAQTVEFFIEKGPYQTCYNQFFKLLPACNRIRSLHFVRFGVASGS